MGAAALAGTQALSAGASIYEGYAQGQALKAKANLDSKLFEMNAQLSETKANDATARGEKEASRVKLNTKQVIGRQRAALAAQGIDVESGTPLQAQEDAAAAGAQDVLTVRNNAWREAWGYRVEAQNARTQGIFGQQTAKMMASTSLLTGGLRAVGDLAKAGYSLRNGSK